MFSASEVAAHSGAIESARAAALSPEPGRLRRVADLGRTLGQIGTPWADALDEIEGALWADGLLPADRPIQQRAWRLAIDHASAAFDDGARDALVAIAAEAVAQVKDAVDALRLTLDRAKLFADDTDIAEAVGRALNLPALPGAANLLAAMRRGADTGAQEATLRTELADLVELCAERATPDIFASLPDGADLGRAISAAYPILSDDAASEIADRSLRRLAQPPIRQYRPGIENVWDGAWVEPNEAAWALHERARHPLDGWQHGGRSSCA